MFDVVLLMAGSGTRTGLPYNKMFYKINNRPLFLYSLEAFINIDGCSQIVLVASEKEKDLVFDLVKHYPQKKIKVVVGGKMRQDSVACGVLACQEELVLIHDGARCFIQKPDILNLLASLNNHFCATLAIPVTDTIRLQAPNGYTLLDRTKLMAMQTPQAVNRSRYLEAYEIAKKEGFYGTDDVALLEHCLGMKPILVLGNPENIKVTTAFDLEIAKAYFQGGKHEL
ncbi:MAG: 2-C-methyl-D-erythritol 4-phosphate cytidylyltransferase [Bacilli bacterium]